MPKSTNMLNMSWTDWQNLTTLYMDSTYEHDKKTDRIFVILTYFSRSLQKKYMLNEDQKVTVCSIFPERVSIYKEM